jgi:Rrf2 family protein
MTNLSRKARYALRALYVLAADEARNPVLIADLAERENIPRKFLETILLELKNAGILKSKKGKGGGYALARAADQITMGQVIRVIDGPLAPIPCASERAYVRCEECADETTCGTRQVMKKVRDAIAAILDSTTLSDVQAQMSRARLTTAATVNYSI